MKFVTVKESHYPNELVVLKSRLESEGINCHLKNELTTQVLNHIPSFLVELQVSEEYLPRVKEIMIETGELKQEKTAVKCIECGSEKLKFQMSVIKRLKIFFSILFLTLTFSHIPLDKLFSKVKYKCLDCGYEFYY